MSLAHERPRLQGGQVLEMQRRRLLLAMQELAGDRGLVGATVGQVCKRSRVSRRTFYDLFDDRDGCFLAAVEQALEQVGERVLPAYEGSERTQRAHSWRVRVRAALEALLALFDEQPQLARLCVVETLKGGPAVLERRRELLDALAGALDEGRAEARADSDPPALTAEATVGGVLAVVHARLLASAARGDPGRPGAGGRGRGTSSEAGPLLQLLPALMGMIVLPYLGPAASRREIERPCPSVSPPSPHAPGANGSVAASADPFRDMPLRFTYRTALVLATIAAQPGTSNRQIGERAGVPDQGQISKLLKRLERAGLVENAGAGREHQGAPNAWRLTARGQAIDDALGSSREPEDQAEALDPALAGGARGQRAERFEVGHEV
jgi:AcrR family transcriptional regulator